MTEHTPAPLPRRRDIHHPTRTPRVDGPTGTDRAVDAVKAGAPRPRRRALRAGAPVALAVMALTTGVVTGLSPASGETRAASSTDSGSSTVGTISTGTFGTAAATGSATTAIVRPALSGAASATSGAVGSGTAGAGTEQQSAAKGTGKGAAKDAVASSGDEALTAAQEALARADQVTTESRAVPRVQRKEVAKSAAHLREVVSEGSGSRAASRAGERTALAVRGEGAADVAAATKDLTTLIEKTEPSAVSIDPAPATPAEVLDAQAAQARKASASLKKFADDTEGYENGRLASADLHGLSFASGESLRRDAAEQLERLDAAYRARFGTHLEIRDSYRSYESQVSVKASRGYLAAVPGYSDHGWGIAVDLNGGVEERSSAQHQWLVENAAKFGWHNPAWAQADGRKPEAWHWEYSPL
ncbi:M15 family metallopeptidase [Krasilnikoviella flava]|uniref:D-alanyl-D-alanine carboxypeptidase n=1 Tax=Krasilnikoviella flava TaxID=526729 RepID=A0A1T5LHD5_9MICO|nr:M15 family metallopeptidase [Krasilnikoviella flava]SKC75401.1 D-alanyl-D-alanine carboxypeptidase [Krasilnikoviella flava]